MLTDLIAEFYDKEKLESTRKLIVTGVSPTNTAKQLGIGRSTLYRGSYQNNYLILLSKSYAFHGYHHLP